MISILYVDDETDLLELGKIFLEESGGIHVDTAPSAQQALQLFSRNHYDAIVSDFQMPDMDGIEFLREIRSCNNRLPVLLFTGKGREDVVIDAINNGADYYIQKGGEPAAKFSELRQKIDTAVARVRSELTIHHFSRLYAIMNGINTTAIHTGSRDELFRNVCRIFITEGGFSRVWIGSLSGDQSRVCPVASCGSDDSVLSPIPVTPDSDGNPGTISGRVAVTGHKEICNDFFPSQDGTGMGTGNADAGTYASAAAFPIWFHNTLIAIIQVFSKERGYFMDEETQLLERICSDISFAIEAIEAEEQRQITERALAESEEKFRILVEESLVGVYILKGGHFVHVNPKFAEITGYTTDELTSTIAIDALIAPECRELVWENIQRGLSGEVKSMHYMFRGIRKDGSIVDLEVSGSCAIYQGDPIIIGTIIDITERKKAEAERAQKIEELSLANRKIRAAEERLWAHIAALTESRERLDEHEHRMTDIINFLPDAMFVIDTAGTVLVWNQAIERMTGIPASEMIGKNNFEYALPFYAERRPILADLVLRYDESITAKYSTLTRDGDRYMAKTYLPHLHDQQGMYAWFVAAPLYDRQGKIVGAIETIRDITEFEEARHALRKTQDRYHSIINGSGEGMIIVRNDRIIFSNPGIRRILAGYTDEELQNKPVADFIHPDDYTAFRRLIENRISGTSSVGTTRFRAYARDGTIRVLESSSVVISGDGGQATLCFLAQTQDPARQDTGSGITALHGSGPS